MMRRGWAGWMMLLGLATGASPGRADQFERLDGPWIAGAVKGPDAKPRERLTIGDLGAMPALLRDTRSALLLATTDRGNPARLLVVPELRKPASGVGPPIPVVVLERLDAFDAADLSTRLATRRDVVAFDGFQIDLDSGQVVPEGQGGDVVFHVGGDGGPRLEPVGPARLYSLAKAPAVDDAKVHRPTPGKAVLPGDFAGRYRLFADGQWTGTLDLKVEARGVIVGQFRSDLHGTTYPVSGQVATDSAQKVAFAIKYPRARQEFEGYLWAEGKGAIAGVARLNERPAGFFAIREGGRYAPEGAEVNFDEPGDPDRPGRHLVEVSGEGIKLDGKPMSLEAIGKTLGPEAEAAEGPSPWVALRAEGVPFREVLRVVEAIRASGVRSIRFEGVEGGR